MKTKIKMALLILLPSLFLIYYKENYIYEGSITFINAINGSVPIEHVIRTTRGSFSVYNKDYGFYYRIYLGLTCLVFMFMPAIIEILKVKKSIKTKTVIKMLLTTFILMIINVISGYEVVGEYFYFYQHATLYFITFLLMLMGIINLIGVNRNDDKIATTKTI